MQLKIWHKLIIGISIPSLFTILGGVLTYEYVNDVKNRQGYVQIADDLKEHVLEVRRNEKNFFHYKNDEHAGNLRDAVLVLSRSVNNISPETSEEIGEETFAALNKQTVTYSTLIDDLYKSYRRETAVTEQVRSEGRKLEEYVVTQNHAVELSTNFILHLRLLEKNFMLFRDKESSSKLNSGLSQLKNITPLCVECNPYIDAVNSLFATYSKSESISNALQETGNQMEKLTAMTAVREREKISSYIMWTQRFILICLLMLCILGPLLVYKTANHIVAPINRLAYITRKISEGDLSLRAPLKEQDETYTLALYFNKMLDSLQLSQQSLERSLELLHEKQAQLVEAKKLASIGTLASGIAHELNNPLNNIYLAAQILSREIGTSWPTIVRETVRDIFSQSLRVKRIVGDLLEFAREKAPKLEKTDIISIVNEVLYRMKAFGETADVNINIDAPEHIEVLADAHLLEQVFVNLFSNAIDAMEGNGALDIIIRAEESSVKIIISDTGKGVSPKDIQRVFDPFFTTKEKGTGLGLAIVYGIIGKHNGKIELESEPGKGSTFTITLPIDNE